MPVCLLFLVDVCLFNLSNPVVISITISAVCLVLLSCWTLSCLCVCVLCYTWRPQPKCKCAYARYSIEHRSLCYWSSLPKQKKCKLLNILLCLYLFYICPLSQHPLFFTSCQKLQFSDSRAVFPYSCPASECAANSFFSMLILLFVCHLHGLCALICLHGIIFFYRSSIMWLIWNLKSPLLRLCQC